MEERKKGNEIQTRAYIFRVVNRNEKRTALWLNQFKPAYETQRTFELSNIFILPSLLALFCFVFFLFFVGNKDFYCPLSEILHLPHHVAFDEKLIVAVIQQDCLPCTNFEKINSRTNKSWTGLIVSVKTANHSPFILLYMFLCLIGIMRRYYIHLMNFGESIAADAHLFTNCWSEWFYDDTHVGDAL